MPEFFTFASAYRPDAGINDFFSVSFQFLPMKSIDFSMDLLFFAGVWGEIWAFSGKGSEHYLEAFSTLFGVRNFQTKKTKGSEPQTELSPYSNRPCRAQALHKKNPAKWRDFLCFCNNNMVKPHD